MNLKTTEHQIQMFYVISFIKFDRFLAYAKKHFACDFIAMGHYAQVSHQKDQVYFFKQKIKIKTKRIFYVI